MLIVKLQRRVKVYRFLTLLLIMLMLPMDLLAQEISKDTPVEPPAESIPNGSGTEAGFVHFMSEKPVFASDISGRSGDAATNNDSTAEDTGANKIYLPLISGSQSTDSSLSQDALTPEERATLNPIVLENLNAGSPNWQASYSGEQRSDDINGQILGYASATSINQGGSLNFHVSVNPAQSFTIRIFRIGWYGGAGGRLMQEIGPLNGTPQSPCPQDAVTGLTECKWANSYTLNVPSTWTTGVYMAVMTNAQNYQTRFTFVVRNDSRVADFLYQQPVTTYQAYNNYPNNRTTGKSLYNFNSYGPNTVVGATRAAKVSFDRPGGDQFELFEIYFVRWAERMGYDISYSTNIDTHINGQNLLKFRGVLSSGHDEYWSKEIFDSFENARDHGVNLAFLGANAAYTQVRFESSSGGVANRVMVSYKDAAVDPIQDPALKTFLFRTTGRPEQTLVGVQYTADGDFSVGQPYIIQSSQHWVWANSGFSDGSVVPGLTGYEIDRKMSNYPAPVSQSYTTLARSPYLATESVTDSLNDVAETSIYQAPSGAWVFASGTMNWSAGLDRAGLANSGIQTAMNNILNRFLQPTTPVVTCPVMPPIGSQITYKAVASQEIPAGFNGGSRWVRYSFSSGYGDILKGPFNLSWNYTNTTSGQPWKDLQNPTSGFTTSDDVFNKQEIANNLGVATIYPGNWNSLPIPPGWKVTGASFPLTWYGTKYSLLIIGNTTDNWVNWSPWGSADKLKFEVHADKGDWRLNGHTFTLTFVGLGCDQNGNINLAQNRVTAQSSIAFSGNSARAVDGNTNSAYPGESVTHTASEANAWWQTDLGMNSAISNVTLWNRTDCCSERLSNFYLFVSATDMSGKSFSTLLNDATVWKYQVSGTAPAQLNIPANTVGRYVRVQLAGTNYLSLAEVQVWGQPVSNVALGKNATQSSTYSHTAQPTASKALDGDTNGVFTNGSVTSTNNDLNSWWQTDLGQSQNIKGVTLWNRTDCCSERLSNFYLFVSATDMAGKSFSTLLNDATVWKYQVTGTSPTQLNIPTNTTGRYVRVQLAGTNYLSLAEVQVWAQE